MREPWSTLSPRRQVSPQERARCQAGHWRRVGDPHAGGANSLPAQEGDGRVERWRADVRVRWQIHGFHRGPQSGSHGHVSSALPKIRTAGFPQYGSKSRRVSVNHALPAEPTR